MSGEPKVNPYSSEFKVSDRFHSVALHVENEIFYVSPDVLAHQSPAFRAMLNEKNEFVEGKSLTIPLPNKRAQDVLILLKTLYLYEEPNDKNLNLLMLYADEYDMQQIRKQCRAYMLKSWAIRDDRCLEALALAYRYKMPDVAKKTLPKCKERNGAEVVPYCQRLPAVAIALICGSSKLKATTAPQFCAKCHQGGNTLSRCRLCFNLLCNICTQKHSKEIKEICCLCNSRPEMCQCVSELTDDMVLAEFN